MKKSVRSLISVFLTLACAVGGYGFYRTSGDAVIAIFFGFGMLGIMMSFLRNTK